MNDPVQIILADPIEAHGGTLTELSLRPPRGKDIRLCGTPFRINEDTSVTVDAPAMAKMVATLAGVPPSAVDQLSARDWQDCMAAVLGFFGTAPADT